MRRFLAALALTLLTAVPVFAGDKIDVSAYLGITTETVLSVEPWRSPPRLSRTLVSHWYLADVGLVASELEWDPAPYEWLVAAHINDVTLP